MENTTLSGSLPKRNLFAHIVLMRWLKKSTIVEIISLLFVILFLYTGISKLLDFFLFQEQLAESPILAPVAPLVAWGLPITEFIVSILLFLPRYRLIGLYATMVMMVLFTAYVGGILLFSTELPCSCGGILEQLSWQGHLVFNGIMIVLSLIGIKLGRSIKRRGVK